MWWRPARSTQAARSGCCPRASTRVNLALKPSATTTAPRRADSQAARAHRRRRRRLQPAARVRRRAGAARRRPGGAGLRVAGGLHRRAGGGGALGPSPAGAEPLLDFARFRELHSLAPSALGAAAPPREPGVYAWLVVLADARLELFYVGASPAATCCGASLASSAPPAPTSCSGSCTRPARGASWSTASSASRPRGWRGGERRKRGTPHPGRRPQAAVQAAGVLVPGALPYRRQSHGERWLLLPLLVALKRVLHDAAGWADDGTAVLEAASDRRAGGGLRSPLRHVRVPQCRALSDAVAEVVIAAAARRGAARRAPRWSCCCCCCCSSTS